MKYFVSLCTQTEYNLKNFVKLALNSVASTEERYPRSQVAFLLSARGGKRIFYLKRGNIS